MRNAKWVVFAVALGMMAATAGWLKDIRGRHLLGPPGVKVGPVPIYDINSNLVSSQSVILPANLPGISSLPLAISTTEVDTLPKDTTFGRRFYKVPWSEFGVQISAILMGTDHTSIHQPQYCLYAQDWAIATNEIVNIHMTRPVAYDLPVRKLTASRQMQQNGGMIECLYIYWFVSGDKITSEEGSRLWSIGKTLLSKGKMERWAYISYFVACHPGEEQATFEHLEKFIRATTPEFQLVTGNPSGQPAPMASQK